jgi:hypothetical protein
VPEAPTSAVCGPGAAVARRRETDEQALSAAPAALAAKAGPLPLQETTSA